MRPRKENLPVGTTVRLSQTQHELLDRIASQTYEFKGQIIRRLLGPAIIHELGVLDKRLRAEKLNPDSAEALRIRSGRGNG